VEEVHNLCLLFPKRLVDQEVPVVEELVVHQDFVQKHLEVVELQVKVMMVVMDIHVQV
jgi:hypothetical protein